MANRPFRFEAAKQVEADAGRFTTLGLALSRRTPLTLRAGSMLLVLRYLGVR